MTTTRIVIAGIMAGLLIGGLSPISLAGKGGKGGGGGKPGGGGDPPSQPDPAIVYMDGADLMVMDADGGNQQVVVANAGGILTHPSWSPDGTRIVFNGNANGSGIYVVDLDGTNLTKLTSTSGDLTTRAVWSPAETPGGGYRILFDDDGGGSAFGNADLFVVETDGTGRSNLTRTTGVSEQYPTWRWTGDRFGAIALDHATLASEVVAYDLTTGTGGLAISGETDVTDVSGSPLRGSSKAFLDWARTTDTLALAAIPSGGTRWDVWRVDLDDLTDPVNLTSTSRAQERQPSWSPDDTEIVFWNKSDVAVMSATVGSGITRLARGANAPDWRR